MRPPSVSRVLVTASLWLALAAPPSFAGDGAPAAPAAPGGAAPAAPAQPSSPVAPTPPAAPAAPSAAAGDPVQALRTRCTYAPAAFEMTVAEPRTLGDALVVESLSFPSVVKSEDPARNDVVRARLFRTPEPLPVLVVALAGWRYDPVTPALAARLARETGIQTLSLDLPYQGERTPEGRQPGQLTFSADLRRNEDVFVQAAQDVARAVDWLVRERKVDPKRVGLLGTSLGGFVAADLYGMSDRFHTAVVQLAGADVASVVFNGNRLTSRIREALLAQGIDEKAARERMRPLDPATWARRERKDGLLLIAAEKDDVVPLATVRSLAEAYGGARVEVIADSPHINGAGLAERFAAGVEHFRARLLPAPAAAPAGPVGR